MLVLCTSDQDDFFSRQLDESKMAALSRPPVIAQCKMDDQSVQTLLAQFLSMVQWKDLQWGQGNEMVLLFVRSFKCFWM